MDKVSQVLQALKDQEEQIQQQVEQRTQTALQNYERSLNASLQNAANTFTVAINQFDQKLAATIADHEATLSSNLTTYQQQANRIWKLSALGGASLLVVGGVGLILMLTLGHLQLKWQQEETKKLQQQANSIRSNIKHLQQEQSKLNQKRQRK
jgi:adenosyl cobinamide kinase/adenosyl cobinamide phosphate guanylyltransferase